MGFLNEWNSYTGILLGKYARDPLKSQRTGFAGYTRDDAYKLEWIPQYQHWAIECPSCQHDLHYSSGWDIRTCMQCGYIEGIGGYHVYPQVLSMSEWLFTVGQLQQQLSDNIIDYQEFREALRQITFLGSPYRPYGEEPID